MDVSYKICISHSMQIYILRIISVYFAEEDYWFFFYWQGGITTLNSNFVKEYDAAVRDLEETRHRTNSQLQGSDGMDAYLNLIFSTHILGVIVNLFVILKM